MVLNLSNISTLYLLYGYIYVYQGQIDQFTSISVTIF